MDKNNLCIYINNYGTSNIELGDLESSNPGIGGTQYEMFLLCELLYKSNIPFTLLLTHDQKFKKPIEYDLVENISEAFNYCNAKKVKKLILRANDGLEYLSVLTRTKVIYWIHNFIDYKSATKIALSKIVSNVVFVSQEEADYYYDHDIAKKGTVIFNAIPNKRNFQKKEKENVVAFIGDLSPYKMVDKLTSIWPKIKRRVPDAKLLIIGSGDLYGKGKKFGKYGIAEEQYEKKILKPLLKHNLLESVQFSGLVKGNMADLIQEAKVTVFINPIETFCIAATDSIKNFVPVICPKSTGYCDVVTNKTGIFFKTKCGAKRDIYKILKDKTKIEFTKSDLSYLEKFSPDSFITSWKQLIQNDNTTQTAQKIYHKNNYSVNSKHFVIFMQKIRRIFHLPNAFSRIGIKWYLKKLIKRN